MKNYKCPYCSITDIKENLIEHIDTEHDDLIPENFTPARLVFNIVNKKEFGICVVCKKPTQWCEESCKYERLCTNPKCREQLRINYKNNMLKVYNKITLLGDADHQQKMLANRKISGSYTFTDGGKRTYTGKYEQKTLEFFDKVMNVKSDDIMSPGPVMEYMYEGKKLKWITDILYIPFNLVIEVKDGGANPNNREMPSYREKQVCKETMITSLGTYNYLRLTDNNFEQLIEILAELKYQMLDDSVENKKAIVNINEMSSPGGMPVGATGGGDGYIVSYGYKGIQSNDVEGFAISNDITSDKVLTLDDEGNIRSESSDFLDGRRITIYKYLGETSRYKCILIDAITNKNIGDANRISYFYEQLSGCDMLTDDQIQYDDMFKEVDIAAIISRTTTEASTIIQEFNKLNHTALHYIPLMTRANTVLRNKLLKEYKDLDILEDKNGYFVYDTISEARSISYKNIKDIKIEGVINYGTIKERL